jgi:hypothetical protein
MKKLFCILILLFPMLAGAQQIIKFKNGTGYDVRILFQSKDTVKYHMIADSAVTLIVSMDQVESISPIFQYDIQKPLRHRKYAFRIDEGLRQPYRIKLISVSDSSIYFQNTGDNDQGVNIYMWYSRINEITVTRKNHIGPYVGLAAGFLAGCIYTASTPTYTYYVPFSLFGNPGLATKTSYPNWWTIFAGAVVGTAIGILIESVVKKKIKMKIHHDHDEYLKYKPVLEKYLAK